VRIGILGTGVVGARAARQVATTAGVAEVLVHDRDAAAEHRTVTALAGAVRSVPLPALEGLDAVVLATPSPQAPLAHRLLAAGTPVVATSDDWSDVESLLALRPIAERAGVPLVVGSAFAPGLTCLLTRYGAAQLDVVDEVYVSKHGTGGPACARQHHRALSRRGWSWRDGEWDEHLAGSGRELAWFPEPVGALDCYWGELPDPLLLVPVLPGVRRVAARVSGTRRDRLTARLPMLRPPHPEGGLGAVRVELRGARSGGRETLVLGSVERAGIAAGAVAAAAAVHIAAPRLRAGAFGLADPAVDPVALLADLARRGVKVHRFVGSSELP
jgi:saccharopine dehydrogenase-like NADP-dependent oxidoreductase